MVLQETETINYPKKCKDSLLQFIHQKTIIKNKLNDATGGFKVKEDVKEFRKTKDYLICIDSDGCVMDTMDVKHMRCFGPCLVYEWDLGEYRDEIIRLWRKVNLLSVTRGVNRFQGLAQVLKSINENYTTVEGLEEYLRWAESAQELSDKSLKEAYEKTENICMKKALDWSRLVNQSMAMVSDNKKPPFDGTEDALRMAREYADIVIVTAANRQEINKEWEFFELAQYTDLLMSQETGRKEDCLRELLDKGYEKDHVLMIGDAPADLEAARRAEVLFYPILAYQERESWEKFSEALKHFTEGDYTGAYQDGKIKEFQENLHIEDK